jgi:NAD(P)H-flavin reductase
LININQTENDLILYDYLDHLSKNFSKNFSMINLLTRSNIEDKKFIKGRINEEVILNFKDFPKYDNLDYKIFICGKNDMTSFIKNMLLNLKYEKNSINIL